MGETCLLVMERGVRPDSALLAEPRSRFACESLIGVAGGALSRFVGETILTTNRQRVRGRPLRKGGTNRESKDETWTRFTKHRSPTKRKYQQQRRLDEHTRTSRAQSTTGKRANDRRNDDRKAGFDSNSRIRRYRNVNTGSCRGRRTPERTNMVRARSKQTRFPATKPPETLERSLKRSRYKISSVQRSATTGNEANNDGNGGYVIRTWTKLLTKRKERKNRGGISKQKIYALRPTTATNG